ncbi:hypothetical protein [Brucella anthropi]|uniref:hypothetical protein n=1 Tax=Brucella anthropi TaxID=529 RepID=UPI0005B7F5F4|nr:hypothetical protein [Brucella anthropi]KIU67274.1 hypothetical protein TR92_17450 [Brucella anthropi]
MQIIGKVIREFRGRSFYIERHIECNCLVVFIGTMDDIWFSITISEGLVQVLKENEPEIKGIDDILDDYAYPVFALNGFERYFGKKISALYSYKINEKVNISVGLYIECEDRGFTIWEENDCLKLCHGKNDGLMDTSHLERIL